MVLAPAANVNVMPLGSPMPGAPEADIVAVPVQVPAYAAGIVTVADVRPVLLELLGLLVGAGSEVRALALGGTWERGAGPWVSRRTRRATRAHATPAALAIRIGFRRDRAGARRGRAGWVGSGWLPSRPGVTVGS